MVKCKWSQRGSKQLLKDFLTSIDPWMEAVSALCSDLSVSIEDCSTSEQNKSALLGTGANGRVFRLTYGTAMKVVVGQKSDEVEKEYALMLQYQDRADIQLLVFPVVRGSFRSGAVGGVLFAGYLLAKVGDQISLKVSHDVKLQLATALYGLHSCGVIHGDPRIQNALMLNGSLKWIDFRQSECVTAKVDRRRDVQILLESVDGSVEDAAEEINAYMNNPTLDGIRAVFRE